MMRIMSIITWPLTKCDNFRFNPESSFGHRHVHMYHTESLQASLSPDSETSEINTL